MCPLKVNISVRTARATSLLCPHPRGTLSLLWWCRASPFIGDAVTQSLLGSEQWCSRPGAADAYCAVLGVREMMSVPNDVLRCAAAHAMKGVHKG